MIRFNSNRQDLKRKEPLLRWFFAQLVEYVVLTVFNNLQNFA